jgi:ferredoxin--NADP+ reductase
MDLHAGVLNAPRDADPKSAAAFFAERVPDVVTWQGWEAIDAYERGLGEPTGRPRVKVVRVHELVAASMAARSAEARLVN